MARLDQLNIGKRLIQIGAVIGREFPYDLLAAVSELPDDELNRALRQLHDTGVIYAVGAPPHSRYIFKHALVRDAAYESLLKRKRRELHAAIASALEKQYPHRAAIEPEILGHHYTEAGLAEQAIANWQKAARQAMRRLTFVEAINHVEKGLNCLAGLTDPTLKMRSELALRTLLGPALMATHGYGAREVEQAYARARELCEQVPETPELFPVLFGLWGFHLVRAEYQDARDLTEQLLSLAKAAKDDGLLVEAHGSTGVTLFYLGELTSSRSHLEQCMTVYDPSKHREHALLYGQDPWVAASSFRGQVMWLLSFPDSALDSTTQAVKRAKEMRHHFSITFSQFLHCCVLHLRREPEALRKEAEAGLVLSEQQGFPYWVPRFRFFRGWALTEQGKIEEGVAEMLLCLDREQASSLFVRRPYYLALLAEAKSKLNEVGMGLEIIEEAIDEFEQFPDRWSEPEIYRIKGELLLKSTASGNDAHVQNEAQQNFEKALALARQQDAKAWELRALLSLYRLHSKQGTAENSRDLLKSVVNTFEEGMKTRDILEVEKAVSE